MFFFIVPDDISSEHLPCLGDNLQWGRRYHQAAMEIANSIWYKNTYHVEQTFLGINKTYYNAGLTPFDFTVTFRADHTFLFVIREQTTGAILFFGKISNSQSASKKFFFCRVFY